MIRMWQWSLSIWETICYFVHDVMCFVKLCYRD